MTAILTAEDVVRRIAAECAYVDERGGVGIRLTGGGDRAAVRGAVSAATPTAPAAAGEARSLVLNGAAAGFFLHLTSATRKSLNRLVVTTAAEHAGGLATRYDWQPIFRLNSTAAIPRSRDGAAHGPSGKPGIYRFSRMPARADQCAQSLGASLALGDLAQSTAAWRYDPNPIEPDYFARSDAAWGGA